MSQSPGSNHAARERIANSIVTRRADLGREELTDAQLQKKIARYLRLFNKPAVWRQYVKLESRRLRRDHFIELPTYSGWDMTFTVEDVAAATGLTVPEVREAITSRRFRAFREGDQVRVTESAFWDFKRELLKGQS